VRLYNPESHQWSLDWANGRAGVIGGPPNVGEFKNGRGKFYCQDTYNGRMIFIRYVWSDITANSAHFDLEKLGEAGIQKLSQLRRRLELRNRLLESRREGVRQTPNCSRERNSSYFGSNAVCIVTRSLLPDSPASRSF
jgi:hypothetical protein